MAYDIWWLMTDMKSVPKQIWWTHVSNFDEINDFHANIMVKIGSIEAKSHRICSKHVSNPLLLIKWFPGNRKTFLKVFKVHEAKSQNRNDFPHRFDSSAVRNKIHSTSINSSINLMTKLFFQKFKYLLSDFLVLVFSICNKLHPTRRTDELHQNFFNSIQCVCKLSVK